MQTTPPLRRHGGAHRWTVTTSITAVLSALAASACCIVPLIVAALGLGGAGLATRFERYRPYFLVLTLLLLSVGFFMAYRRRGQATGPECCEPTAGSRVTKVILWIATVVALIALAFPTIAARFGG